LEQVNSGSAAPPHEASVAKFRAALEDGHAGKALAIIRDLPDALRQRFDIAAHQADLLGKLGRHEEELAVLRALIAREPPNPSLHLSVAHALKTIGRADEAITAAREAIALRPDYGKAWWVLADLKTYRFADSEVAAMQSALAAAASPADRLHLHFALGRAFEQRGEFEPAFAHYADGNAIQAAASPRAALNTGDRIDRTIATFTPEFLAERDRFGLDNDAPIFIVGLHRSGSTLIEQILASHSQIEATAELPIIAQLFRSIALDRNLPGATPLAKLAAVDQARSRSLGAEYLERANDYLSTTRPRFIDKMPANWLHVGFIRLILPNATIIDARRHPMAAGFSNFRQNYGSGAAWAYSLESIGRYYRDYLRLMRHFDRVLPGKIHRVVNERLIDDFEPEVRRLLARVGVEFEPACLEFHRSNRPVRSASAEQVRRPINREGIDQWRAFEPWLGPLKDALGPALKDWQQ
jgi:tetratricopeptide (TPR) repeat protein